MSCNQLWCSTSVSTQTWYVSLEIQQKRGGKTLLVIQSVHTAAFFKTTLFRGLYISVMVGKRMNGKTTSIPLGCSVFWMAVLWVVMVLRDHSWERQACFFVGWMRGGSQLSLGCLRSYGRREMCCFQTVRGKVMMQHGWEGGDEWDLLHNLTSFPKFQIEFELWA